MTRKEQKEQRQKQIMMKALELFVTKGYSETKISDIAGELGISVGLLFHYYESKEQLYLELVKAGLAYSSMPQNITFEEPLAYFEKTLDGLFAAAEAEPMVYFMFVLMSQAQRQGMPEEIRKTALSAEQMSFSAEGFMPRAQWKRMVKGLRAAENRMRRYVRTAKRRKEKERRRRVKEVNNG